MISRGPSCLLVLLTSLWAANGCSSDTPATPNPDGGVGGTTGGSREPILDGGGVVVLPPDGGGACPAGSCNYQTGQGCTAGTQSCVPLPSGSSVAPACESAGTTPSGGSCTQWTDCASGMICAAGACHKLCCGGDWTGCPSGEHCIRPLEIKATPDAGAVQSGASLCFPINTCDALVPTSCTEPGTTCQIADATGVTACLPEGTGGDAEPCPCKGGYLCVANMAVMPVTYGCRRLCKAVAGGGEPSCSGAQLVCVHFWRDPEGVGECTPTPD